MKAFTVSAALTLLVSVASAAPSATQHETRDVGDEHTRVKFTGVDGTSFIDVFPLDDEYYDIYYPNTVNTIESSDNVTCQFWGSDGDNATTLVGGNPGFTYVNPPQPQATASCARNYGKQ
ncbi:MAG: hypothetical protein Q9166_003861 [cf. Caloplaca sp. 2 TL-2023]